MVSLPELSRLCDFLGMLRNLVVKQVVNENVLVLLRNTMRMEVPEGGASKQRNLVRLHYVVDVGK